MSKKLFFAINPSYTNTGIAYNFVFEECFENDKGEITNETINYKSFPLQKSKIGKSGQILKSKKNDISVLAEKLNYFISSENNFSDYKPIILINEMFSQNTKTLTSLYEIIGAIKYIASAYNLKVIMFNEKVLRKIQTGYGGSDRIKTKNLSIEWAKSNNFDVKNDDEADALMLLDFFMKEKYKKEYVDKMDFDSKKVKYFEKIEKQIGE